MASDEGSCAMGNAVDERAAAAMAAAEEEAGAYLERAKARVDAMLTAAAEGAAVVRSDQGRSGPADAERLQPVEEARRIAEGMVAERQRRLAALSDGIAARAAALTAGMDEAARIRAQFDSIVRSLSATADMIADECGPVATTAEVHDLAGGQ